MNVYYNENYMHAAEMLRHLMDEGMIPGGVVDERSIQLVKPGDLRGFTQCHFFAGVGGWTYALRLAGWPADRQVWTGSCPCQPFSSAGIRRGFKDERHLWPIFARLIAECRPVTVFGEQVAIAAEQDDWLDLVQTDLQREGYAVGATVFPAASVGAPHQRDRLYFVADADHECQTQPQWTRPPGDGMVSSFWSSAERVSCPDGRTRLVKPGVRLLADGVSGYMDIMRGAGNAIVPQQAATFVRAFIELKALQNRPAAMIGGP